VPDWRIYLATRAISPTPMNRILARKLSKRQVPACCGPAPVLEDASQRDIVLFAIRTMARPTAGV